MRIKIDPYGRYIEVLAYDNISNADLLLERVKFNHLDAAAFNPALVPPRPPPLLQSYSFVRIINIISFILVRISSK